MKKTVAGRWQGASSGRGGDIGGSNGEGERPVVEKELGHSW